MNPAVALVQAYLQLNGFLTVAEFPIASGDTSTAEAITDVDIIAIRFPGARAVGVTAGNPELPDPLLAVLDDAMDLLICEVKEGKARLNPNLRRRNTLHTTLARVGCCPPAHAEHHVRQLRRYGVAEINHPGVRCRARLALFAGRPGDGHRAPLVIDLHHVAVAVCQFLVRHQPALHAVRLTQPALAHLQLLTKLGLLGAGTGSDKHGRRNVHGEDRARPSVRHAD